MKKNISCLLLGTVALGIAMPAISALDRSNPFASEETEGLMPATYPLAASPRQQKVESPEGLAVSRGYIEAVPVNREDIFASEETEGMNPVVYRTRAEPQRAG